MANLRPLFGHGFLYGSTLLRGTFPYVEDPEIENIQGVEIQFFSQSGELIDSVSNIYDKGTLLSMELKVDKIGGLISFNFTISRDTQIPFYNLMIVKFIINGNTWYTGELLLKPDQDRRRIDYKYEGKGYIHYLKKIKIDTTYTSTNLDTVLKDVVQNELCTKSPIIYNPELIITPSINITTLEFKKKDLQKVIDSLLEMANYDYRTTQYIYGVNKDRQFYFYPMSNIIVNGFFEGFQYQEPDVKSDDNKIVNIINIYRAQEASQQVEFIQTIQDSTSIDTYGERFSDLTISDYVDSTTAQNIANAILELKKQPIKNIKVDNLIIEDLPYDFGFYNLNNKVDNYNFVLSEFNTLSDWNISSPNTIIEVTSEKVFTGKTSFKVTGDNLSYGDYIELELGTNEIIYFPNILNLYVSQNITGNYIRITVYDEEGTPTELKLNNRLKLENGDFLLQETGDYILLEGAVTVLNQFYKLSFDISDIVSIEFIKIEFLFTTDIIMYLDRLEIEANTYIQNKLELDNITYSLNRTTLISEASFGDKLDTIFDSLKELNDKQVNLVNIFQKS